MIHLITVDIDQFYIIINFSIGDYIHSGNLNYVWLSCDTVCKIPQTITNMVNLNLLNICNVRIDLLFQNLINLRKLKVILLSKTNSSKCNYNTIPIFNVYELKRFIKKYNS